MSEILRVRPWRPELQSPLLKAAEADNHLVIAPTHVVMRGNEVVGYSSIGGMPLLHVWLRQGEVHPRESVQLLATAEALAESHGVQQMMVPVHPNSHFAPHMERLGFHCLGATVMHIKNIGKL